MTSIDRAFADETRTYDNANRLLTIDNTSVGQATYTWDANSNKLSETWTGNMAAWSFTTEKSGGTFTDGYDAEDRFRRFIQSSQSNDIYLARSDIGNISDVEINSVSNLRSYSNAHELTTVDGTTQTFDDDGNLTLSHHGITVAWDDANRLTQTVVPPTATAGIEGTNDYGYDADNKRVWKKITRSGAVAEHTVYIYAGPNCIAEYNSGTLAASPVQEYVYSGGIDSLVLLSRNSDADRYVATRNQQWSITALADISNGTVQERYTYDPFGKRTILAPDGSTVRTASSYNMPYGYTSRRHDPESDLMYFRARYYDPSTGEFTSRDPLEYVDGMSMFRGYFLLNGVDPLGLADCYQWEWHHWFPQEYRGQIEKRCPMINIDYYTTPLLRAWGCCAHCDAHGWLHSKTGFQYNRLIKKALDTTKTCCQFLLRAQALMEGAYWEIRHRFDKPCRKGNPFTSDRPLYRPVFWTETFKAGKYPSTGPDMGFGRVETTSGLRGMLRSCKDDDNREKPDKPNIRWVVPAAPGSGGMGPAVGPEVIIGIGGSCFRNGVRIACPLGVGTGPKPGDILKLPTPEKLPFKIAA